MPLSRSPARSTHEILITTIGRRILSGGLQPAITIDPTEFEREFSASRTAVREALRVLQGKGLIEARARAGTTVSARSNWALFDPVVLRWRFELGADDALVDELAEVRSIVEPEVARLAAERRTDRDIVAMADAWEAMAAAQLSGNVGEHVESDVAFHHALLTSAHNELLTQMGAAIEMGLRARDQLVHTHLSLPVLQEHEAVLTAVRRSRPRAAKVAMRALLDRSVQDIARLREVLGTPPD